jgi:plastocyanin
MTHSTAAPIITSASSAWVAAGRLFSFTLTATGTPTPALSESGSLPVDVTFVDGGDGTAVLSGTPPTTGEFDLTVTAANGQLPNAVQTFTLVVARFIIMPLVPGDTYSPDSLTADAGDTVVASNQDDDPHTVTADGPTPAFDTGIIAPGTSKVIVLNIPPGTYAYHCQIHSFMHGTLQVNTAP